MQFNEKLIEKIDMILSEYYNHPFVKGIGNGDLDINKFRFYIIQDYFYLLDYAKICSLAVVKSNDLDVMKKFSSIVNGILNLELENHNFYMDKLNISKDELQKTKRSLKSIAYSSYIMSVAYNGSLVETAVSLLACIWSYRLIGLELAKIEGSVNHDIYGRWIREYISEEYKELNEWLIDLVNKLAKNTSIEQQENLFDIFIYSSRFEKMFWDMAYLEEL